MKGWIQHLEGKKTTPRDTSKTALIPSKLALLKAGEKRKKEL
jgi:hypothetical protein